MAGPPDYVRLWYVTNETEVFPKYLITQSHIHTRIGKRVWWNVYSTLVPDVHDIILIWHAKKYIAWSRCFAYMHNSRSLTPSQSLKTTILANYGVRVLCLSRCLILNQTIKRQLYKWKMGDFPVPVGRHGSSTSSPATLELIALVWTLRTLFWKDAMRYCRNHAHFTIFLFSACMQHRGWARDYWLRG